MVFSSIHLVHALWRGGMGSIWSADHLALRTPVVVKFMAESLAEASGSARMMRRTWSNT